MKGKYFVCTLLLALLLMPSAARADGLVLGQKPPRNEQSEVFVELYKDGIATWNSTYDRAFEGVEQIVLWRYPGSGQITGTLKSWFHNSLPEEILPSDALSPCYMDGEGRFWGYINYIYGHRMSWICLSDPANEGLPADPEMVASVDKGVGGMLWRERAPATLLVAVIVVGTAALLCVIRYKKKKTK